MDQPSHDPEPVPVGPGGEPGTGQQQTTEAAPTQQWSGDGQRAPHQPGARPSQPAGPILVGEEVDWAQGVLGTVPRRSAARSSDSTACRRPC